MLLHCLLCFFCKQKTAYEMRISDWSSDVCSSDLREDRSGQRPESIQKLAQAPRRRVEPAAFVVFACTSADHLDASRTIVHAPRQFGVDPTYLRAQSSEERRVGKECVSTCSSRWLPDH